MKLGLVFRILSKITEKSIHVPKNVFVVLGAEAEQKYEEVYKDMKTAVFKSLQIGLCGEVSMTTALSLFLVFGQAAWWDEEQSGK